MGSRSGVVPGPRRTSRRSLAADGGEADGGADRVDAAFALAAPKKDQEREKASEKRRRLEGENPGGVTAVLDVQRAEELAAASRDSEMIMGNALAQSSPVCMSTPPGGGSSPGSEAGAKGSPGAKMSLSIKVPGTAEKHDGLEPSRTPHRHRSSSLWHAETPKLHNAIYNAAGGGGEPNVAELTRLLEDSSTRAFIDWPDPTEGWTGIMAAATVRDGALSASLCGLLLQHKASVDLGDKAGMTALHWAAATGNLATVKVMVQARGDLLDKRAKNGETALHKAARYGYEQVCLLLLSAGASAGVRNEMFMTAIDVAGALDHFMEWQSAAASTAKPKIKVEPNVKARRKVRRAIMSACAWSRVLVVSHQECMLHATKLGHQEAPRRVKDMMDKIRKASGADRFEKYEISICEDFECSTASIEQKILQVHSEDYVKFVKNLSVSVSDKADPVPFTPRVMTAMSKTNEPSLVVKADSDTFFSRGSYQAALKACGAVCHAVDEVVQGRARRAFCCVRPPGHHAGREGLIKDCISCGFCIFNNVVIGACHALDTYTHTSTVVARPDTCATGVDDTVRPNASRSNTRSNTPVSVAGSPHSSSKGSPGASSPAVRRAKLKAQHQEPSPSASAPALATVAVASQAECSPSIDGEKHALLPMSGEVKVESELAGDKEAADEGGMGDDQKLIEVPAIKRVAMIDLDVHHGNGTEELVRWRMRQAADKGAVKGDASAASRTDDLFFFSIHLFHPLQPLGPGSQEQYEFYPGTGATDLTTENIINVPVAPCWCAGGAAGPTKGTRGYSTKRQKPQPVKERERERERDRDKEGAVVGTEAEAESCGSGPAPGAQASTGGEDSPTDVWGAVSIGGDAEQEAVGPSAAVFRSECAGRGYFRQQIAQRLVPALRAYNPDLVLVSMGFDGAHLDVGNANNHPLFTGGSDGGLDLLQEDYKWATQQICAVADVCCDGRVVSVLEGGYGKRINKRSADGSYSIDLDRSDLADNGCAHVRGLVGSDTAFSASLVIPSSLKP